MKQFYLFVLAPYVIIMATWWAMPNVVMPDMYFYVSITAMLLCHQIVWLITYGKKKMEGEIVLKRVRKKIHYSVLVFTMVYTFLYATNPAHGQIFLPILFGFLAAFEFGNYFLIKWRKPDAMAICGQVLIVDFYYPVNRDLSELSCFKLNGFNKRVEIVFTNRSSVYFYGNEFAKNDLKVFITVASGKSRHEVAVAGNLLHYLNTETPRVAR